jgi:hypothetical protein
MELWMQKSSKAEQLARAKNELAAANAKVAAFDAAETEAAFTAEGYIAWRAERYATSVEVDRLMRLIGRLEPDVAQEELESANAELRKRYAAKKQANIELAARIREKLQQVNDIVMPLLGEVATSLQEDIDLHKALPDEDALESADFLARGRLAVPAETVAVERVLMWAKQGTDFLTPDQNSVVELPNGKGVIDDYMGGTRYVKSIVEKTSFQPCRPMQRPVSLLTLRLPFADRPGYAYDGTDVVYPRDALRELSREKPIEAERPIETKLRFVEHVGPIEAPRRRRRAEAE